MAQHDDHLPISTPIRRPAEDKALPAEIQPSESRQPIRLAASPPEMSDGQPDDLSMQGTLRAIARRRTAKPLRYHATGGPKPQTGIRGLAWRLGGSWLYARFGWRVLLQLSLKERYDNALNELWRLRHEQKIVTIVNSKGGSCKTTLAVWLSAMLSHAVKRHVVALDANENTGHTASRLGIKREDTIQLRKFLKQHESLDNLAALTAAVDWHRETGVSVIASEAANNSPIPRDLFIRALATVKRSAHAVFCDCGNGIPHPANRGSVQLADTLVFPGNAASGDSLRDISNTMMQYSDPKFQMVEKVTRGVIVIVGAKESERLGYAHHYDFPLERVFTVPKNRYMAGDNVVNLNKVPLRVRVILLEILVAILMAERAPSPAD